MQRSPKRYTLIGLPYLCVINLFSLESLKGKKILIGVSGSIAAYKSLLLVRLLIKAGAEVRVLMTPAAAKFVSPLSFSTLSKHPVAIDVIEEDTWNNHVELGLWADAMVVAPATANTLAKMANGICDNIICACYLSARCPVFFAPAMDLDMWKHPATQSNVSKLLTYGNHLIDVGDGELASGLSGKGRMAEPEETMAQLDSFFRRNEQKRLIGKKILLTAGPTFEPIDPVRFIGNRSTGKMGIALAGALLDEGAEVLLVLGPVQATLPIHPNLHVIKAFSADAMYKVCVELFPKMNAGIMAAAVADYTPKVVAAQKIKKNEDTFAVELVKTKDIAASLGKMKQIGQILVGFALETQNEIEHANGKLEKKNLDFVVLNSLNDAGAGFGHDTNKITILKRDGESKAFGLKSKNEVARDIVDELVAAMEFAG